MKTPAVIEKIVPKDSIKGSIGRKWAVDGVTKFPRDLDAIHIEVYKTTATSDSAIRLASLHEHGHASTGLDVIGNIGEKEASFTVLSGYDRWQSEVEAWMRGLEHYNIDMADASLILDCLNSYRRGIPAKQSDWLEMLELLATVYTGDKQDLYNYVPLEPDPGEKPRQCLPDFNEDDGRGGDGEEEDGEDGGQRRDYDKDNPFDNRWLEQDVLDEIAGSKTIEEVAKARGLDPNRLPPLLEAMR